VKTPDQTSNTTIKQAIESYLKLAKANSLANKTDKKCAPTFECEKARKHFKHPNVSLPQTLSIEKNRGSLAMTPRGLLDHFVFKNPAFPSVRVCCYLERGALGARQTTSKAG
jgi:hypothetical protein